jgi:hypothetical protein
VIKDVAEEAVLKVVCFGEDAEGESAHICILYRGVEFGAIWTT